MRSGDREPRRSCGPRRPSLAGICQKVTVTVATALAGFGLTATSTAQAQNLDPKLWVTNGPVYATALSGKTLYIGGAFTYVGPYTGGGVPTDATDGLPIPGFPKVQGSVRAIAADGSGGWYIGGAFDLVGGVPRANLAHIRADLTVGDWDPGVDGLVQTLAVSEGTVYAGGGFTIIGGQARNNIAALDALSGAATTWNPGANNWVWTIAVGAGAVYAGGDFTTIGGETRSYVAALDISTGLATGWNPAADSWLESLALSGGTVYAAGNFTSIGGQARNRVAALDETSGLATPWNPDASDVVRALAVDGNTIYVGGDFVTDPRLPATATIGGQPRNHVAAIEAATGLATPWNPDVPTWVRGLAVSGGSVYVGGDYIAAAYDIITAQRTTWDPRPNAKVRALSASGGMLYVGGEFTSVGGQGRPRIAALDTDTGEATAWNPIATGTVRALAVRGNTVYAGGDFSVPPVPPGDPDDPTIGGQPRNFIAALDATTGLATAWNPDANWTVYALAAAEGTVYAGGTFTTIGGQGRSHIAALDATTGQSTSWDPNANGQVVSALAVSGNTVHAGGNFTTIGGQARNRIAALDRTTGLATEWNPNASGSVLTLAVSGDWLYAGGSFTIIGGQPRNRIASLWIADGSATSWNPNANGIVRSLAVSGNMVYAGGDFTAIGGQARNRIAKLDVTTAMVMAWNVDLNNRVWTLAADDAALYAGGEFTLLGGKPCLYLAGIRDDWPTATLLSTFTADWRAGAVELVWAFADVTGLMSVRVERAPRVEGPWIECAVETRQDGDRTVAMDRDILEGTTYWYRLVTTGASGLQDLFGPIAATTGRTIRGFTLGPPGPNPSGGELRIEFDVPWRSRLRLRLFDVQGRELATLLDGDYGAGRHQMIWDGSGRIRPIPVGVHFLQLETPEGTRTRRIVVAR